MTLRTSAILLFSSGAILFGGCTTTAFPDLIVKDFKSTVVNSEMIYFVNIQNIGNADANLIGSDDTDRVIIKFNLSETSIVPPDHINQLPGAGDALVIKTPDGILKPNEELEAVYKSGRIPDETLNKSNNVIVYLETTLKNDGNTSNNINVTRIIKPSPR